MMLPPKKWIPLPKEFMMKRLPNGHHMATKLPFLSNRTTDPDRNENTDIWVIDAKANATMKQITTWTGSDSAPQWSPDGKQIVYLRSTSSDNYIMNDQSVLCVVSKEGGEPKLLSKILDRTVGSSRWTKNGTS